MSKRPFDMKKFMAELQQDEGLKLGLYKDSLGYWTIGVGVLVSKDKSMTKAQAATRVSKMVSREFRSESKLTIAEAKLLSALHVGNA